MTAYKPYVYFVYSKITNEFYIGSRRAHVKAKRTSREDLWKHYFTSSVIIKNMITEFGADSFSYEVLFEYETENDLFFWDEQKLIKEFFDNPLCLNKHYFDPVTKSRMHTSGIRGKLEKADEIYYARGGWSKCWDTPAYIHDICDNRDTNEIIANLTGFTPRMIAFLKRRELNRNIITEVPIVAKKVVKNALQLGKETSAIKNEIISRISRQNG